MQNDNYSDNNQAGDRKKIEKLMEVVIMIVVSVFTETEKVSIKL